MHIDLSSLTPVQTYATMTQTIVPRPIAWILTENKSHSYNLAPYSYFNALSSNPAMAVLSVGVQVNGALKDTRINLEEREFGVIHIAHREMAEPMTATAATMEYGVSEVKALNLELADMPGSTLPRIADCRIAYAAKLVDTKLINTQWLAFLELSDVYIDDDIVGEDSKGRLKVLADKLDPIGRLGGGEYVMAGDVVTVARPK